MKNVWDRNIELCVVLSKAILPVFSFQSVINMLKMFLNKILNNKINNEITNILLLNITRRLCAAKSCLLVSRL